MRGACGATLVVAWLLAFGGACGGSAASNGETAGSGEGRATSGGHGHGHGHGEEAGYHHDFSNAEHFAARFDDPERDAWQKPEEVVSLMEIAPGMTVVDLGAGTGYFLSYLSRAVGPEGHVLALDVEPNMVAHMRQRIQDEGLDNVEVREVAPDDPGLAPDSVNRILIVDTWHHIGDRGAYTAKLARALTAQGEAAGRLYVVDFTEDSPHGPPAHARIRPEVVADEMRPSLTPRVLEEDLPYQYVVVGEKTP